MVQTCSGAVPAPWVAGWQQAARHSLACARWCAVLVCVQCMHENYQNPRACEALCDDYLECLHHRKYVSVCRGQTDSW